MLQHRHAGKQIRKSLLAASLAAEKLALHDLMHDRADAIFGRMRPGEHLFNLRTIGEANRSACRVDDQLTRDTAE